MFPNSRTSKNCLHLPLTALSVGCIDTVQILPLRKEGAIRRIIMFIMLQYCLPHFCLEQITRTLKGSKTHHSCFVLLTSLVLGCSQGVFYIIHMFIYIIIYVDVWQVSHLLFARLTLLLSCK